VAGTTDSWKKWYEANEVDEWIQSVAGVLDQGWNDQLRLQNLWQRIFNHFRDKTELQPLERQGNMNFLPVTMHTLVRSGSQLGNDFSLIHGN
jgi:hypothetical protein